MRNARKSLSEGICTHEKRLLHKNCSGRGVCTKVSGREERTHRGRLKFPVFLCIRPDTHRVPNVGRQVLKYMGASRG